MRAAVCIALPGHGVTSSRKHRKQTFLHQSPDQRAVALTARSGRVGAGRFSAAAVAIPVVSISAPGPVKPVICAAPGQREGGLPRSPGPGLPGRHLGAEPPAGCASPCPAARRPSLLAPPALGLAARPDRPRTTPARPAACSPPNGPDQAARNPPRREGARAPPCPPRAAAGGGAQPT